MNEINKDNLKTKASAPTEAKDSIGPIVIVLGSVVLLIGIIIKAYIENHH